MSYPARLQLTTDASGNTSLVVAGGGKISIAGSANTICMLGDSMTALTNVEQTCTISQTAGVATVHAVAHLIADAQTIKVFGADQSAYNGFKIATWIDADNFSFTVDAATVSPATSATASLRFARYQRLTDVGFFTWANGYLGGRMTLLNNGGVGGEKTADMILRLQTDVIAYSPSYCTVLGGINDITGAVAEATIEANLQTIYTTLHNAGIKVIALTILPLAASHANYATANPIIVRINTWIRNFINSVPGIYLVDAFNVVVDPTSTGSAPLANYLKTDYIHPAAIAAQAIGYEFYRVMNAVMPPWNMLVASAADNKFSNATNKNILDTAAGAGLFLGTGGTASGTGMTGTTVAATWTCTNEIGTATAVATTEARTVVNDGDAIGWNQVVTISSAASGNVVSIKSADFKANLATGDRFFAEGHLQCSGMSAVTEVQFYAAIAANSGAVTVYCSALDKTDTTFSQNNISLQLRTPVMTMPDPTKLGTGSPGTIANVKLYAWIKFGGAGAAVMKLGRCSVRKV